MSTGPQFLYHEQTLSLKLGHSLLKNPEPNLTHANGCPTSSQISSHPHLPAFVSKFPRRVKILICTILYHRGAICLPILVGLSISVRKRRKGEKKNKRKEEKGEKKNRGKGEKKKKRKGEKKKKRKGEKKKKRTEE